MSCKCDLCGKFRKKDEVTLMQAEGDEQWIECVYCMSESDKETFFKHKE